MAAINSFALLGDDDNDDPSQLIAAQQQNSATKKTAVPASATPVAAKLPTKPLPPSQAGELRVDSADFILVVRHRSCVLYFFFNDNFIYPRLVTHV